MDMVVDLHTHTVASGHAYSTLAENARAASERGLKLLGMTDHGPSMPGAPTLYHFGNLSALPEELYGVRILTGVEANITSQEGELDVPLRYLAKMKVVLVGLHVYCYTGGNVEQNTRAYLKAMKNPYTDIMVHPGRPEFELDLERVAKASADLGVPVEINNSSLTAQKRGAWDNCRKFASFMAKFGGPVVLGSDAHFRDRVGEFGYALELISESGILERQILNTSVSKVLDYLALRRQRRDQVE